MPASDVEVFRTQAQAAQLGASQQLAQFKSEYPTKSLKFDYIYRRREAVRRSGHLPRRRSLPTSSPAATEKFAVYELKDGKPNSINFELRDGTYVIPKVVDRAYLEIGKKRMEFVRREQ